MQVLHLLTNKRWTERADPAAGLALAQKALGHSVFFACSRWPWKRAFENSVQAQAEKRGLEPVVLATDKHFRPTATLKDLPKLKELIRVSKIAVLHAHMENAHLLTGISGHLAAPRPLLFNTCYDPDGPATGLRASWLYRKRTDGLVVINDRAKRNAMARFGLPERRVQVIEPGIDLSLFAPGRTVDGGRETFGLEPRHFVVGMVTRLRQDRRPDLPINALRQLVSKCPDLRLLIIGRGEGKTWMEAEIEQHGLGEQVRLGGYCRDDRLVAAYRAMDLLVYPTPGSDRSCRTVREAMAAGIPVVASRTGFLPDLIEEGKTGRFTELTPESLAAVIQDLHDHSDQVAVMGDEALRTAHRRFDWSVQARKTIAFYEMILAEERVP